MLFTDLASLFSFLPESLLTASSIVNAARHS